MENLQTSSRPIPLYYHIVKYFNNQIDGGALKSGERLPSESELQAMFGVSRITIRRAMDHLENVGVIIRKSGKGTYVSESAKTKSVVTLSGNIGTIVQEAKQYETRVVDKVILRSPGRVCERLQLNSETDICRIRRVRMKNAIPYSYVINYLSADMGEKIAPEDFGQLTLIEILKKRFKISVIGGEESVEAKNAHEIAPLLGINAFDPVLYMEIVYDTTKKGFKILTDHYYRGDFYKYKVALEW
jgi:GntR family transcriptional regulator